MTVTQDLYKALDLDRAWDEATIKRELNQKNKENAAYRGSTNDKEELLLLDQVSELIRDGFKYLVKAAKRKLYDEALDKAYKDGTIRDENTEKLKSLLEKAREYYRKGNTKLAAQCAQEAIDGKVNDPDAYEILARCQLATGDCAKALSTVDNGANIFTDNITLIWLGARIATIGLKNYDEAQLRINRLLEIAPNSSIGQTEQIYMHLRKGEEDLAFQEVDTYLDAHPADENFKRFVAYDIISYSDTCYYYDPAQNASFIADKASYEKSLKLRTKAESIYHDEYTQKSLENTQYYGQKEWDSWNSESIKALTIYGIIFLFLFLPVGLVFLAIDALLVYYSYRPYWQINKTYVTGEMGTAETIVNRIGDYAARFAGWFLRFIWNAALTIIAWFIRFILRG